MASDIYRDALKHSGSLLDGARGSATDEFHQNAARGTVASELARTSAGIDTATAALRGGALSGSTTAQHELRKIANGGTGDRAGSSALDAARAAAEGRAFGLPRSVVEDALGLHGGVLAKTVADMQRMGGLDANALSGLASRFDRLGSASSELEKLINRPERDPLFADSHDHRPFDLPPMAKNPVHRTNELLGKMTAELTQQRDIIEASATAQQRETELLAELVGAFAASQAESGEVARRANHQAWIGIVLALISAGVAILTVVITWPKP